MISWTAEPLLSAVAISVRTWSSSGARARSCMIDAQFGPINEMKADESCDRISSSHFVPGLRLT